jgi:hypothetical protein
MLLNSSTVVSRPCVLMFSWNLTSGTRGAAPTRPTAAWVFCELIALMTSSAVMPRLAMRSRFSQMRIEYSRSPHWLASPTPGTRFRVSTMSILA